MESTKCVKWGNHDRFTIIFLIALSIKLWYIVHIVLLEAYVSCTLKLTYSSSCTVWYSVCSCAWCLELQQKHTTRQQQIAAHCCTQAEWWQACEWHCYRHRTSNISSSCFMFTLGSSANRCQHSVKPQWLAHKTDCCGRPWLVTSDKCVCIWGVASHAEVHFPHRRALT